MSAREQKRRDDLQKQTDLLADFVWLQLHHLFRKKLKKRPEVFFFLSRRSHGSLSQRNFDEILLVRSQQARHEGITLLRPPQIAYVSDLAQVPEETAHLFALRHGPRKRIGRSQAAQFQWMVEHEASARMCAILMGRICGHKLTLTRSPQKRARPSKKHFRYGSASQKRSRVKIVDFWRQAHEVGYRLGEERAREALSKSRSRALPARG